MICVAASIYLWVCLDLSLNRLPPALIPYVQDEYTLMVVSIMTVVGNMLGGVLQYYVRRMSRFMLSLILILL